jgi:ABC-2 type transport system permease protein
LHETFAGQITSIADTFPPEFSAVLGDISAAAKPEGFLNLELYSLFLPFAVAITGIVFAARAIGKEEDSGTLELLLASPISRSRVIIQKLVAILLALFLVAFSPWLGVVLGKALFVFDANLANVALASLAVYLLGVVYAMSALAGQAITGQSKIGLGAGAGLLVVTYFANVLSSLVEDFEWLKYSSPFHYMDVSAVLNGNGDVINYIVLLSVAVVLYALAHVGFLRRDTGV